MRGSRGSWRVRRRTHRGGEGEGKSCGFCFSPLCVLAVVKCCKVVRLSSLVCWFERWDWFRNDQRESKLSDCRSCPCDSSRTP